MEASWRSRAFPSARLPLRPGSRDGSGPLAPNSPQPGSRRSLAASLDPEVEAAALRALLRRTREPSEQKVFEPSTPTLVTLSAWEVAEMHELAVDEVPTQEKERAALARQPSAPSPSSSSEETAPRCHSQEPPMSRDGEGPNEGDEEDSVESSADEALEETRGAFAPASLPVPPTHPDPNPRPKPDHSAAPPLHAPKVAGGSPLRFSRPGERSPVRPPVPGYLQRLSQARSSLSSVASQSQLRLSLGSDAGFADAFERLESRHGEQKSLENTRGQDEAESFRLTPQDPLRLLTPDADAHDPPPSAVDPSRTPAARLARRAAAELESKAAASKEQLRRFRQKTLERVRSRPSKARSKARGRRPVPGVGFGVGSDGHRFPEMVTAAEAKPQPLSDPSRNRERTASKGGAQARKRTKAKPPVPRFRKPQAHTEGRPEDEATPRSEPSSQSPGKATVELQAGDPSDAGATGGAGTDLHRSAPFQASWESLDAAIDDFRDGIPDGAGRGDEQPTVEATEPTTGDEAGDSEEALRPLGAGPDPFVDAPASMLESLRKCVDAVKEEATQGRRGAGVFVMDLPDPSMPWEDELPRSEMRLSENVSMMPGAPAGASDASADPSIVAMLRLAEHAKWYRWQQAV